MIRPPPIVKMVPASPSAADRACIESREVMKLVHFVREALGVTPRQFFDWLQEQNWKLTVELKNLKTRLVNERKL